MVLWLISSTSFYANRGGGKKSTAYETGSQKMLRQKNLWVEY